MVTIEIFSDKFSCGHVKLFIIHSREMHVWPKEKINMNIVLAVFNFALKSFMTNHLTTTLDHMMHITRSHDAYY